MNTSVILPQEPVSKENKLKSAESIPLCGKLPAAQRNWTQARYGGWSLSPESSSNRSALPAQASRLGQVRATACRSVRPHALSSGLGALSILRPSWRRFPTRSILSCGGMKLWVQFLLSFAAHLNCQRRLLPPRFPKKILDFSHTLCQTYFCNRSLSNLTYNSTRELSVDSHSNRFVQTCQGHIL